MEEDGEKFDKENLNQTAIGINLKTATISSFTSTAIQFCQLPRKLAPKYNALASKHLVPRHNYQLFGTFSNARNFFISKKGKRFYQHADVFFGTFQVVDHRLQLTALDQMLYIQAINLFGSHLTEATMSSINTISKEQMQPINTPELLPKTDILQSSISHDICTSIR